MSDIINDGGPAFPFAVDAKQLAHPGMSLRDYFAGQAVAQMDLGHICEIVLNDPAAIHDIDAAIAVTAATAYRLADAMIAARAKVDAP